jgi:hypothetical protein
MGNTCSCRKSDNAVEKKASSAAASMAASAGASSRPMTTASEATTFHHGNHNLDLRQSLQVVEIQQSENGHTQTASIDMNGSSSSSSSSLLYYDAVDSFSHAIFSMSYPPTSSMVHGRRVSLWDPQSMLSSQEEVPPHQRASVIRVTKRLESHSLGIPGYPGELNDRELQACLEFREQLKVRDEAYREVVYHGAPIEDEAFALCRLLRAREFRVEETFQMMAENQVPRQWNMAKSQDFYRDLEKHVGCPTAVLMTQIPLVVSGIGKNGATVIYLGAGSGINVEGVECITDMASLVPFVWYFLYEEGKRSLQREAQRHDPSKVTILAERIIVMDLAGVPGALFSSRGMDFIKEACKVPGCFPEIINRMYMLNAPFSFNIAWNVIKLFVEPRTVQKTGFFSNKDKATQDLLSFVDTNELLSDYGGTGPSFAEVQFQRQQEVSSHHRYIVETMTVSKRETDFNFKIDKTERIHSITLYTKTDYGAAFSVTAEKKTVVDQQEVKPQPGRSKTHYKVQLGTAELPTGPAEFVLTARGAGKANYLVAVAVDKT